MAAGAGQDFPVAGLIDFFDGFEDLLYDFRVLDYYSISEWLRASAPVSIQQSTNIFQRFGRPYSHLLGNERRPGTRRALTAFVRAAAVRASLTGTRIAVFPSPCRVVISTWLDELELASRFVVKLVYVSVAEYEGLLAQVREAQVRDTVAWLKGYPVSEVDEEHLRAAARQSMAIVAMAEKYGLSGIAIEDFNQEFYTRFDYRPHLFHSGLGERFCTVGLEADVLGVLATVIVGRLAGRVGMFTEFYTVDPHRDLVLMGHPGYGELSFAQPDTIQVTPDIEIDDSHDRGVWISYRAAEGLFERILSAGLFQHWGAAYGDIRPELAHLLRLLGVEEVRLD